MTIVKLNNCYYLIVLDIFLKVVILDSGLVATIIISFAFAIFLVTFITWIVILTIKKIKTKKIIEKTIKEEQENTSN